jgi:hypothetical protein
MAGRVSDRIGRCRFGREGTHSGFLATCRESFRLTVSDRRRGMKADFRCNGPRRLRGGIA